VAGKLILELVIDGLNLEKSDTLWLVVNSSGQSEVERVSRSYEEICTVRVVTVPFLTRGPVETIMAGISRFMESELKKKIVCIDSDSCHGDDILSEFRDEDANMLFYFKTDSSKYSHILLEEKSIYDTEPLPKIKLIKEKDPMSSMGLTGAYAFKSGNLLRQYCVAAIEANTLWLSELCQLMLDEGKNSFLACQVKRFFDLAEAERRRAFVVELMDSELPDVTIKRPMKIAVSLESLLTCPEGGDLSLCAPLQSEINKIRKLKAIGHRIVITTERFQSPDMLRTLAIGNLTLNQIRDFKIPFDEIYFGQPRFDMLVTSSDKPADLGIAFEVAKSPEDAILPRAFNQVDFISPDRVQKTSKKTILDGEIYFYKHIPADVQSYFPKFIEARETGVYASLVMERVNGTPLTNLLITHCLGARHLNNVLVALRDIHNSKDAKKAQTSHTDKINVYVNYAQKVRSRFQKHWQLYYELFGERRTLSVYRDVLRHLAEFEGQDRALRSPCIHGDPVFSNILDVVVVADPELGGGAHRRPRRGVILLDMRGKIGSKLTVQGDAHYDLAKLLQCLYGYDFVLQGCREIKPQDKSYLARLREQYFAFVKKHYSSVRKSDLLWITASHYFSLVPLHSERSKQELYLKLCFEVYKAATLEDGDVVSLKSPGHEEKEDEKGRRRKNRGGTTQGDAVELQEEL